MRVPVINQPSGAVGGAPGYTPQVRAPNTSLEQGLAEVGAAAANVAGNIERKQAAEQERARREAEALARANADTEFHRQAQRLIIGDSSAGGRIDDAFDGTDTSKGGFLATKGLAASEQSADVLKRLGDARKEIAATISSPEARAAFLSSSAETALAYSKQVEGHVSKQFAVAQAESAKGADDIAINLASSGADDRDAWLTASKQAVEAIRANAVSKVAGDAAVVDFNSRNALAYTTGLIAQGKTGEAKAFVEAQRATLGTRFPKAADLVGRASEGEKKDQLQLEMRKHVDDRVATIARADPRGKADPSGYLTEQQIRDAVPNDGYDAESARIVEDRIRELTVEEQRRRQQDTNNARDVANNADLNRRPIPGATYQWLEKYDPDFLLTREARREAQYERWLARQQGTPAQKKKAEEEQKADDLAFRYRLERRLTEDPSVSPADVEVEFAADMKRQFGRSVAISQPERERGGASSAKAVKQQGTAIASNKAEWVRAFGAELKAKMKPSGRGAKVDAELLEQRKGRAATAYQEWVDNNGNKPLDATAAAELKARLIREVEIEITPPTTVLGFEVPLTGSKKSAMGVDLVKPPSAAPAGDRPIARNPKTGERRYLNADGSLGEVVR